MTSSANVPWNGPAARGRKPGEHWPVAFVLAATVCALTLGAAVRPCAGDSGEQVSLSGRLQFAAQYALDRESVKENPDLAARLIVDDRRTAWNLHGWIEGDWQLDLDNQQVLAVKPFDRVYGSQSRPLDVKEAFAERQVGGIDWRLGVQRFSWGRLDEYPINDLFNPWNYDQFLIKTLQERKIGVPALSAGLGRLDWSAQLVWAPWFVPYRLPEPGSRWALTRAVPESTAAPLEPDLPARTLDNGAFGLRIQRLGEIEGALNLFHGIDPRPILGTRSLPTLAAGGSTVGVAPAFHPITAVEMDAATVLGPVSLRGEAAWTGNRVFNIRRELWGPAEGQDGAAPAVAASWPSIERARDTIDYGIAADYRPFEDGLLTVQAQQSVILSRPEALYERRIEPLLWVNLKVDWLNQKIQTHANLAHNPDHGASMVRAGLSYLWNDAWKADLTVLALSGPSSSLFGRYALNDQIRLQLNYQW